MREVVRNIGPQTPAEENAAALVELKAHIAHQQAIPDIFNHPKLFPLFSRGERKKGRHLPGATRVVKLETGDSIIDATRVTYIQATGRVPDPKKLAQAAYLGEIATFFDRSGNLRAGEKHIIAPSVLKKLAMPAGVRGGYSPELLAKMDQLEHHADIQGPLPDDKLQLGFEIIVEMNSLEGKEGGLHYLMCTAPLGEYPHAPKEKKKPEDNLSRDRWLWAKTWKEMYDARKAYKARRRELQAPVVEKPAIEAAATVAPVEPPLEDIVDDLVSPHLD